MKRNITLDYLKIIMSLLVVIIHSPIFWESSRLFSHMIVNGICRIAVPCFFVLNGLYLKKVLENNIAFRKYIKRLFIFYIVWMLIYAPFYLFHFKDSMPVSILMNISSILFGFWHLWYIIALIGGVILLYFLKQKNISDKQLFKIALFLFIIGWLVQKVELFYPDEEGLIGGLIRSSFPSRNFLFMGFPFVAIGYLISKKGFMEGLKKSFSKLYILILCFLFLFSEALLHFYVIGRRGFDFYIILIVLCPALILFLSNKSKIIEVEDDFISKLSAAIYFIHPLVLYMMKDIFLKVQNTERYILIIFFSVVFGSALIYANKRLKIFF
ncbi:acyltransferase family protein [Aquimarina addita]|uniref:Acyltransferase family protein n=1 Tax=Aquimarina addita TaxID=870485 RepID=A0ABP7XF72_9FLAO